MPRLAERAATSLALVRASSSQKAVDATHVESMSDAVFMMWSQCLTLSL
jgi:hypothetical protein